MSLDEIVSKTSTLQPTKRAIISLVGRIYDDPLGILSPIVVQLKIFVQELCEARLGWDQMLTGTMLEKWYHLSSTFGEAKTFLIPRCYLDS